MKRNSVKKAIFNYADSLQHLQDLQGDMEEVRKEFQKQREIYQQIGKVGDAIGKLAEPSRLKEKLVESMVYSILIEIVNSYSNASVWDIDEVELGNFIKEELTFSEQELEQAVQEVWEQAKDNVCYGDGEYWSEKYQVTPLATERIINEEDTQEAIMSQIRDYCL